MKQRTFTFEGFDIQVEQEALWGLVLSHLPGKDLRSAQRIFEQVFLDLLRRAQAFHGKRLAEGSGALEFRIGAAPDLKDQCAKLAQDLEVRVHLMTHDNRLADVVRMMLPDHAQNMVVGPEKPASKTLPWGGLLLIDSLPRDGGEGLQTIMGLDRLVQRHLVDATTYVDLPPQDRIRAIPLQWHAIKGPSGPQKCGVTALASALDEALFSRAFGHARALNQRWRTQLDLTVNQEGNMVEAVLRFAGVEKILQARDLKLDIGWGEIPEIRLKDVLGLEAPKARIREYLQWLKDPHGAPGLKAAVLFGPPGTGKTHLALGAGGEASAPTIIVSASSFQNKFIGESERIIRETFAAAQKYCEVVMVIDELDALAWSREQSNEWMAQTQSSIMGALLTSLDTLRKGPGRVLLLCTSNQIHRIDSALTRSLRMERIHVGLPCSEERGAILKSLLENELEAESLVEVMAMTAGLSPADLVHLSEEATKTAANAGLKPTIEHVRQAIFQLRRGEVDHSLHLTKEDQKRVAYHESGHALLAHDLLGPECIAHLSVIPTAAGALGAAYLAKPDSAEIVDRARLKCHLAVLLGGKAAELALYPEAGAGGGVASDLSEATRLASQAIIAWGMDDTLPPLALEGLPKALQNVVARQFVDRIQAWIMEAELEAMEHLARNRGRLNSLAERLLKAETLHRPTILEVLATKTSLAD